MKTRSTNTSYALRVWLPAVALGGLLVAEGFAVGVTGVAFVALAVMGAGYAFLLLERASPGELGLTGVIRVLLLFITITVPMLADGRALDGVNLARFVLIELGAITIGIALVGLCLRARSVAAFRNGMGWPVLALFLGTVLSAIFARNFRVALLGASGSYDGVLLIGGVAILFCGYAATVSLRQLRAYLVGLAVAAGGPVMFYALLQYRDRIFGLGWLPDPSASGPSLGSTLGNQNHLAALIALLLPVVLALAFTGRRWKGRAGYLAFLIPMLTLLVLAGSEGAFVAALAGVVVFAIGWLVRVPLRFSLTRGSLARIVIACVPIAIVVALFMVQPILDDLARGSLGPGHTSTAGQRLSLWSSAVEMAQDRPMLGWGPDSYRLMFPTYQGYLFVQSFGPNQLANGAHNLFFNQLANTGVIGLAALVGLITFIYLRGVAALRRLKALATTDEYREPAHEARFYVVALLASITAYLVQASFNVQQVALTATFWFLAGLLTVASLDLGVSPSADPARVLDPSSPPPERNEPKGKRSAVPERGLVRLPHLRNVDEEGAWSPSTLFVTWILIALGVLLAFVLFRPYRAARTAYQANLAAEAIDPNNPPPVERRFELLDASSDLYEEAFELNPWKHEYARAAGNSEYLYGANESDPQIAIARIRRAAEWYGKAHDLRPRDPEMMLAYSRVFSALLRRTGLPSARGAAVETIRRAFQINPWDADVSVRLVSILKDLGRLNEAKQALRVALEHRPDDSRLQDLAEQIDVAVPSP